MSEAVDDFDKRVPFKNKAPPFNDKANRMAEGGECSSQRTRAGPY